MKGSKNLYQWHHWCGLLVGLMLVVMSLTGSLLVFSDEIESIDEPLLPLPAVSTGTPYFDASFHTIRQRYPAWEIRMYHQPEAGKALVYDLRKKEISKKVYADPVSGAILKVDDNANHSIQRRLLLLHYTLFSGTAGKLIVFCTGILFLLTLVTGIVVYRRYLFRVVTFRVKLNRKTPRSFYSSLHRIVGVWALVFNLLLVCTGLWLSGNIAWTALKPATQQKLAPAVNDVTSIDAVVAKLQQEIPGFEIHLVRSRPATHMVQVSGRLETDPSWYGRFYSVVMVNGSKAEIATASFMKDLPANKRLSKMAGPLHFGNYGGLPLKIFYSLLGLTPGFLSISGYVMWSKRKRKSRM